MRLDKSRFPVVFIRHDAEESMAFDKQLDQILDMQQKFVLITDHAPGEHQDETHEEREQKKQFLQHIKGRMRQYCEGLIITMGDKAPGKFAKAAAVGAGKVFKCPILFASDEEHAEKEAVILLAKSSQ